jgi:4-hydroxybenzoate polyprenyltransferase/phosphoserine phosphatase
MPSFDSIRIESLPSTIVVDLDGTLLRTDSLHENLIKVLMHSPHLLLRVLRWLMRGRAFMKNQLMSHVPLSPEDLPMREPLLKWLHARKADGHKIVLASAADDSFVKNVASHLKIFDQAVGSSGDRNLKGKNKVEALRSLANGEPFFYIGDALAAVPLWQNAQGGIAINPSFFLRRELRRLPDVKIVRDKKRFFSTIFKAIRLHQWAKNILVFAPAIAAHKVLVPSVFWAGTKAFFVFSFCGSAGYLVNDLFDLHADRHHRSKRHRPLASGQLSIVAGIFLAVGLLAAGFGVASQLSEAFVLCTLLYIAASLIYSYWIKSFIMADVLLLAMLYAIRMFAGGKATQTPITNWFLLFALFMFLGLALLKRYTELRGLKEGVLAGRRGYRVDDQIVILVMGIACSFISILIFALYMTGPDVTALYRYPDRLWFLNPCLVYWLGRLWLLAHRNEVHDDPVVFTITDKSFYATGAAAVAVLLWAS